MVHPVGQRLGHFRGRNPFKVRILFVAVRRCLWLVPLFLFPKLIEPLGTDLCARRDPGDLSSQIVCLVAGEGRVAGDRALQPASEELPDFASGVDLRWGHRRQLDPGKAGLLAHIVHTLVGPRAIGLFWHCRRGLVGRLWQRICLNARRTEDKSRKREPKN